MIKNLKSKDHDEWLALRRDYIGGSEAASIVGMNPYKSAYALWAEKTGKTPEYGGNLACDVGTYLEEFIAQRFATETSKKVKRHNATMVNDEYPWAEANVDRLIVGEDAGLECKSTSEMNLRQFKGNEFPEKYYCQCVHYLAVTGKKRWYLAVLIGNKEFKVYCLERDEAEIASLMEAERKFKVLIDTNTPPAIDGADSTADALLAQYPNSNDNSVSLMAYESDLRQYIELGKSIKELKNAQDEVANRVKAFMGNAGKGESGIYKVTWTTAEQKNFDTKKFVLDHGNMNVDAYYKSSSYRTFKVNERK